MELAARYSNLEHHLKALVSVLERVQAGDRTDEPGVQSAITTGNAQQPVVERLSPAEIAALVASFDGGTPKHVLAKRYGISESSVKRLLRKYRKKP